MQQRACFECHGAEADKGGLRLHEKSAALKGGKHQAAILPGRPEASELLRRISLPRTDKQAMPRRGTPLTAAETEAVREWIRQGAEWPEQAAPARHWAYQKPDRLAVPAMTTPEGKTASAIDAFILQRLALAGIPPAPQAAPHTLLRRVFFDITGLPPTDEELTRFLPDLETKDMDDASYEALVDHLLASPEFGVKWARHWLDLARYADSHGFQRDDLREIWGYRDWVVNALNADMPFDQFTVEQVAGDLLPGATPDQVIATGFHRCKPTNVEAGTEPEESRINQVIDRVNTTGAVWLGTTLECAQCHNHKYDPFSQKDYYQLLAYFNSTEKEAERENPKTPGSIKFNGTAFSMPDAQRQAKRAGLERDIQVLKQQMNTLAARPALSAAASKPARQVLKPATVVSAEGAEADVQPDLSVLFIGEPPEKDICSVVYEGSPGAITGFLLEALTDASLPGEGPGRGDSSRPNFVLQDLQATLVTPDGKEQALKFSRAYASFSQKRFEVEGLIDDRKDTGWAINPEFHKPHWAALALPSPLQLPAGSRIRLKLVQEFGGARTIGRLRFSAFTGSVESSLPEDTGTLAGKGKAPRLLAMEKRMTALQKQRDALAPPTTEVMRELPEPRMTAIFKRGVYTDHGEPVTAGLPAVFETQAKGPPNRLALARWLVSRENPLTARVTVNRLWAEVFGQGIVTTVEDFGIKGSPPSHPELLDWLAVEFMEQGWSLKKMLKRIVLSRTYRQDSRMLAAGNAMEKDPSNALLWHGPRFRLDAEAIRDNALTVAGLLSRGKGGAPIRPPQPDGLWAKVGGQKYNYQVSPGEQQFRRGLYVVLKRGAPYPSFVNFDASARMACVVRRGRSNTPLQALTLLNDPVYAGAARALADRMEKEPDLESRVTRGFRLALAREPAAEEMQVMLKLFNGQAKLSERLALEAVATTLLNLDETITKN